MIFVSAPVSLFRSQTALPLLIDLPRQRRCKRGARANCKKSVTENVALAKTFPTKKTEASLRKTKASAHIEYDHTATQSVHLPPSG